MIQRLSSSSASIGFGLVGVGMIADYYVKAIAALATTHDVRLTGVLGRSAEKAAAFAKTHQIPFHTADARAFFAHPEIQVVCIVTPSGAHLEPALQGIQAGKHLIVEKPLEISVERVDAMLDAAERADVKIAAIFQARFSAGALALKAAIDAGRFGRRPDHRVVAAHRATGAVQCLRQMAAQCRLLPWLERYAGTRRRGRIDQSVNSCC